MCTLRPWISRMKSFFFLSQILCYFLHNIMYHLFPARVGDYKWWIIIRPKHYKITLNMGVWWRLLLIHSCGCWCMTWFCAFTKYPIKYRTEERRLRRKDIIHDLILAKFSKTHHIRLDVIWSSSTNWYV